MTQWNQLRKRMNQDTSIYETIGGESKVRELVNEFYHLMDTLEEAKGIRAQHGEDLEPIKEKLFDFLSGWLGGPPLFIQKYGHPKLRARHLPFKIGLSERDQWITCMFKAMENVGIQDPTATLLRSALFRLADHMRNIEN
jgi:hemoglobin